MSKWFRFFIGWLLPGLLLLLISIIVRLNFEKNSIMTDVLIQFLQSIGIALIVGSIFDLVLNTKSFTNTLSKIFISKSFLSELSEKEKKQSLQLILQPPDKKVQYYNFNKYFSQQIDKSMKIFENNFRSEFFIKAKIYKEDDVIKADTELAYRVHKGRDKYESFPVYFDSERIKILKTIIETPDGKSIDITPYYKSDDDEFCNFKHKYEFKVPDEYNKCEYLNIRRKYIDIGYDHWLCYGFLLVTPSDGVRFELNCEKGLKIKENVVYDNSLKTELNEETRESIIIRSSAWLNTHSGFMLIIGDENTEVDIANEIIDEKIKEYDENFSPNQPPNEAEAEAEEVSSSN
ncbi:MAG: hypothetical protein FWD48_05915 [Oscillospiraceae bacterium]|nr:hypothetical protein [Oscillospiraceae bacterium]